MSLIPATFSSDSHLLHSLSVPNRQDKAPFFHLQALFLQSLSNTFASTARAFSPNEAFSLFVVEYFLSDDFRCWFDDLCGKGFSPQSIFARFATDPQSIFNAIASLHAKSAEEFWVEICTAFLAFQLGIDRTRSSVQEVYSSY